jgi:hypothetical protein
MLSPLTREAYHEEISYLHTTTVTVEPLKALAKRTFATKTRSSTSWMTPSCHNIRKNGSDIHCIAPRWIAYAHFAEEAGADNILNACSSVGETLHLAQAPYAVPIVRIDAPMAELRRLP